jgi:hypothetical protein
MGLFDLFKKKNDAPMDNLLKAFADGKMVMVETLKTGNSWNPDIAFLFSEYKNIEGLVNSKYPFGNMDEATRKKYIGDLLLSFCLCCISISCA